MNDTRGPAPPPKICHAFASTFKNNHQKNDQEDDLVYRQGVASSEAMLEDDFVLF